MSRVSSNDCAKGCVAIFEGQGRLREPGCGLEYLATNLQRLEAERGGWEVVKQDDGLCDGDLTGERCEIVGKVSDERVVNSRGVGACNGIADCFDWLPQ